MPKKLKTKFEVQLRIDRLLNVPYVQGHFFTKVKTVKADTTVLTTSRKEVAANTVEWNETGTFEIKVSTDAMGLLVPFFIKVSVRRESKGGKSTEKLGAVTIDFTQFAGAGGAVEKRYLLQAGSKNTDKKQGKDNSMVQITVSMSQCDGDPIFRALSRDDRPVPKKSDEDGEGAGEESESSPRGNVDLEDLEASLLRLLEASSYDNVGTTALPAIDPKVWISTREQATAVVDSVLANLGPPAFEADDLGSHLTASTAAASLEEAFLQPSPDSKK